MVMIRSSMIGWSSCGLDNRCVEYIDVIYVPFLEVFQAKIQKSAISLVGERY